MSKTAFISGVAGQDGSHLAELLLDKGYEVHGLVRRSSTLNTGRQHVGLDCERYVRIDERYSRPTEVNHLHGDASKAAAQLGWKPEVLFENS